MALWLLVKPQKIRCLKLIEPIFIAANRYYPRSVALQKLILAERNAAFEQDCLYSLACILSVS